MTNTPNTGHVIVIITYDPEQPDDSRIIVGLKPLCRDFLATLSDLELKVFATEVGLRVTRRLEMPPSPPPLRAQKESRE